MIIRESDGEEVYFAAAFAPGDTPALVIISQGMDLQDASDYLDKAIFSPVQAFRSSLTGEPMLNIWTFDKDRAKALCAEFTASHTGYTYGNSKKVIEKSECDQTYKREKIYFEHFHLLYSGTPFTMTKVRDIHVLFGNPLEKKDFT